MKTKQVRENCIHRNVVLEKFKTIFCKRDYIEKLTKIKTSTSWHIEYKPSEGAELKWLFIFGFKDKQGNPNQDELKGFCVNKDRLFFWFADRDKTISPVSDCPIIGNLSEEEYKQFNRNFKLAKKATTETKKETKREQKLKSKQARIDKLKEEERLKKDRNKESKNPFEV